MKRYKKGFTLIELLAVIVVLGVLSVIVVPLVFDQLTNAKGKLYTKQVDLIEKASQRWGEENEDQLPLEENQYVYVSIDDLNEAGFIDRNKVKDPRDGSRMNGCVVISYNAEYHQNIYQYKETPCSELHEGGMPNIVVEGGSLQGVEVYTTYVLPKVSAKSESGTPLTVEGPVIRKDNKIVEEIGTKKIKDLYTLTYRAMDEASMKEAEKKIKVKVIDTIAPEIEVNGKKSSHTITHELGTTFKIPTPKVTDNSRLTCVKDAKSGCRYTVTTNVAANKVGTYQVVYTATDAGEDLVGAHPNTSAYILTVKVIDTKAPVIKKIVPNTKNWTNQDVTLTIVPEGEKEEIKEYSFDNGKTWQKSDKKTFTANQKITALIKDYSGNISKSKSYTISNIDKEAPKCTVSIDYGGRELTSTGWINASQTKVTTTNPIKVTGICSDTGGSGCVSNPTKKVTGEGKSIDVSVGKVKDHAGNEATCQTVNFKIDQTKPSCEVTSTSSGWTNQDVTIKGTCSDSISGCQKKEVSKTYKEDTNGKYSPGVVIDYAGNSTTCAQTGTVQIDKTPPSCPALNPSLPQGSTTTEKVTFKIVPTQDTVSWDWYTNQIGIEWKHWGQYTGEREHSLSAIAGLRTRRGKVVVRDHVGNERSCETGDYYIESCSEKNPTGCKKMYICRKGNTDIHDKPTLDYTDPNHQTKQVPDGTLVHIIGDHDTLFWRVYVADGSTWTGENPWYQPTADSHYGYLRKGCARDDKSICPVEECTDER